MLANTSHSSSVHPKRELGLAHRGLLLGFAILMSFIFINVFKAVAGHANGADAQITSGFSGYCLDDHNDSSASAYVDVWGCNDSSAQVWSVSIDSIKHDNQCLSVSGDSQSSGAKILLNNCNNSPGQLWLRDGAGFYNPNSELCLSLPASGVNHQLVTASCNLSSPGEIWSLGKSITSGLNPNCNSLSKGNAIACNAEKEWVAWNASNSSHGSLLNRYTDGAPYEEWCADFVSYIYKESGYPFTGGETNGWDENDANNIANMGFTQHDSAIYTPKPGDVAYFDYSGGHVEIVVSGGKNPTFIYGNSATIDPTTGNGQMEANSKTSDGDLGSLVYYLSPN